MRYRFVYERRIAVCGAGRAVAAFLIAEECSTDERIGQVGVAHNNLGCIRAGRLVESLHIAPAWQKCLRGAARLCYTSHK